MDVKEIIAQSYISKSKLPDADYVINPYVGCPHKCIYCYAEFMKRFTGHANAEWGNFVDVKKCGQKIDISNFQATDTILLGSVTDAYNPFEKKYQITRDILTQLLDCEARIEILTKSDLVLRDIDLLKKMRNVFVGISMNTLDDTFRAEIEPHAASIENRIRALRELKNAGIPTYLFMSPIFPVLSDCKSVIENTYKYFDYICFENLNLRGGYLPRVMEYIKTHHADLYDLYKTIYWDKNMNYWEVLKNEIESNCKKLGIDYRMYFYHDLIKKKG